MGAAGPEQGEVVECGGRALKSTQAGEKSWARLVQCDCIRVSDDVSLAQSGRSSAGMRAQIIGRATTAVPRRGITADSVPAQGERKHLSGLPSNR